MTTEDLARLVNEMRTAQREFFRTRSDSALNDAKAAEAKVDKAVNDVLSKQQKLF